ncbi:hypothetical protein B0F90DRAFT_1811380 [Multifurca ochricompacta]|uniref:Uncharacterized protein n=1 Tax=Multifurca ochricompacta TaxID=376703 RepID=A0AAD4LZL7_9AGAM|nr:hypothetical protein B0F90DRAFT_1811380 [Multifurca ochricompacta]
MVYGKVLSFLVVSSPEPFDSLALWHPSMWGFNATAETFPYDNRPVSPLAAMNFTECGGIATAELGCNKGATSFFASSEGGDIRNGNDPCPGSPMSEYHTQGPEDVKGCALAIAYKSNANDVKPEDFTVFSVNQTCVLHRFTDFAVPARMPPCPDGKCICAWFWIHSPDSGGEQNYMNSFQCNVIGSTSSVPLAKPKVARRCGADPNFQKPEPFPGNCTYGAKQPFYWFQNEANNMFEGTFAPPFYLDLYNFLDGAQDDIFEDSYVAIPTPGPNQTILPLLNQAVAIPVSSMIPSQASSSTDVTIAIGQIPTSTPVFPAPLASSSSSSSSPPVILLNPSTVSSATPKTSLPVLAAISDLGTIGVTPDPSPPPSGPYLTQTEMMVPVHNASADPTRNFSRSKVPWQPVSVSVCMSVNGRCTSVVFR